MQCRQKNLGVSASKQGEVLFMLSPQRYFTSCANYARLERGIKLGLVKA